MYSPKGNGQGVKSEILTLDGQTSALAHLRELDLSIHVEQSSLLIAGGAQSFYPQDTRDKPKERPVRFRDPE